MITKEDAIKAIKKICMYDGETPQMIWSTDAMDAVRGLPDQCGKKAVKLMAERLTPRSFGRFVRRARYDQGLNLRDMEKRLKITNASSSISRMESSPGKQGPTLRTMVEILDALGYELRIVKKQG